MKFRDDTLKSSTRKLAFVFFGIVSFLFFLSQVTIQINTKQFITIKLNSDDEKENYFGDLNLKEITKKTFKNQQPKIVFFAGLPYSHQSIIKETLNDICPLKCISLLDLELIDEQLFFPRLIKNLTTAEDKARSKLNSLRNTLDSESIVFVNIYNKENGVNVEINSTYPDLSTSLAVGKSLRHPNILYLEDLFNSIGFEPYFVVLFNDLERISTNFLFNLIHETKLFKSTRSIALLKMLGMNLRNLVAQSSFLTSKYDVFDFTLLKTSNVDDDLVRSLKTFEENTKLEGFTDTLLEKLKSREPENVSLKPGEQQYLEKMKIIQQFYSNKLQNRKVTTLLSKPTEDKPRVIFFAGLEGTGHHLWREIAGEINISPTMKNNFNPTCQITKLFFDHTKSCFEVFLDHNGLFCSAHEKTYMQSYESILTEVNNDLLEDSDVVLLNLPHFNFYPTKQEESCTVIASYPAFSGKDKSLNKPDLIELALLFNQIDSVDLVPVVLLRRTGDFVYSDVWRRKFHKKKPLLYEEKVLENNAASLLVEIEMLGADSVACVDFSNLVLNPTETDETADAIRVNREDLKTLVSRVYSKNSTSPEKILPDKHNDYIKTLHRYNKKIYELCRRSYV